MPGKMVCHHPSCDSGGVKPVVRPSIHPSVRLFDCLSCVSSSCHAWHVGCRSETRADHGGCWQDPSWPAVCAFPPVQFSVHPRVRPSARVHTCASVRAFVHLSVRPSISASARLSLHCLTHCAAPGPTLPCSFNAFWNSGATLPFTTLLNSEKSNV